MDDRPEILPGLELIWDAFAQLHNARPTGFGPSPIPMESIESWMRIHGVESVEDRARTLRLIQSMDVAWCEWANEKADHGNAKSGN